MLQNSEWEPAGPFWEIPGRFGNGPEETVTRWLARIDSCNIEQLAINGNRLFERKLHIPHAESHHGGGYGIGLIMVKVCAGFAVLPAHLVRGLANIFFLGVAVAGEFLFDGHGIDAHEAALFYKGEFLQLDEKAAPYAVGIGKGAEWDILVHDFIYPGEPGQHLVAESQGFVRGLLFRPTLCEVNYTALNDNRVNHEAPAQFGSEVKAKNGVGHLRRFSFGLPACDVRLPVCSLRPLGR